MSDFSTRFVWCCGLVWNMFGLVKILDWYIDFFVLLSTGWPSTNLAMFGAFRGLDFSE